ncbi:Tat (twin-arginine translocation) pathway signal sequence [Carboxydocella thermautotrophica]|nr:Tat (twin-arginine translocation) pathway signal sequence [Carboxydocella thermautotrophica]
MDINRRDFLKTSALLGGVAVLAGQAEPLTEAVAATGKPQDKYPLDNPENMIYSVCLQCNTGCGIKVKLLNGQAVKIDGNPYSPWTMYPSIKYATDIKEAAKIDGAICPKGQSGIQTVYDPYRIRRVLKRAGKRGSNKWVSIPFSQAIKEIVYGGKLFASVPGEENRVVPGLMDVWALRDPQVAKAMAADVENLWNKKMTLAEFQSKWADQLDKLIDPAHPDLGPKNNQFVFAWGRLKGGRSEFIKRFTNDGLGSINTHGHTTVCQGSLYFTGKAMSEQYAFDSKKGKVDWTGGDKFYWQADTPNSEFILFVGASPFEANYGPAQRVPKITEGLESGRLKIAVVDPRYNKAASKAWKWLPNKPGTEAAVALAMINWIISNNKYDARYLANANKAAATADGEPTWSNASWLVKIVDGKPTEFLRGSEIGLPKISKSETISGTTYDYELDPLVVWKDGQPVAVDPNSTAEAVEGELDVETTINGITVKSSFRLLKDHALSKTIDEWADICGLEPEDLIALAREFTSHGKKAAADVHRGVSQHTNGFYNVGVWMSLNLLIGNFDWKGGMIKASTYNYDGTKTGKPFDMTKNPGKIANFGISSIRHNVKYENTTIFNGYPAKRHWYTLASDVYQEIIPSIGDAYPYPVKVLFQYMGSPVYSLPGGHKNIEVLSDVNKLPLYVAFDIVVGESSMYADYIFPDLTYLERWEFHGSHPNVAQKVQPVRQPAIAPLTEKVTVYGQTMPISLETVLLAIAEEMKLPGFGTDAFGPGRHLKHQDDMYIPMLANLAFGDDATGKETVPEASAEEIAVFYAARKHLPKEVFDPQRWQALVGESWFKRIIYLLNRGGLYQDFEKAYDGEKVKNKYGKQINLYQEKTYKTKNSMTGKAFPGLPQYIRPYADALGRPINDLSEGYNLTLITYKDILHTKSRTASNYWNLAVESENYIWVNPRDAYRYGLKTGDRVKIVSASNTSGVWDLKNGQKKEMIGKVKVTEGIRDGVIAFSLGWGHWSYGSQDVTVDGKVIKGDSRRRQGVHGNAAMRLDPVINNTCISDLAGGSAVFYDTRVKLVKV